MTLTRAHGQLNLSFDGAPALSPDRYEANKAQFLAIVLQHEEDAPITGERLGVHFGVDKRVIRDWAHRARVEGNPIGSSTAKPKGYFHARTKEQKERTYRQLLARMGHQGEAATAMGAQAKCAGCDSEQPRLIVDAPTPRSTVPPPPPVPPTALPLAEDPTQYGDRVRHPELGAGRVTDYQALTYGDRCEIKFDLGGRGWFYLNEVTKLPRDANPAARP